MRNKKVKRIRKMLRQFEVPAAGQMFGDQRTVRYYYRQPDGIVVKTTGHGPEGSMPLVATYTLMRQPNDPRRMYRRIKREAIHHG